MSRVKFFKRLGMFLSMSILFSNSLTVFALTTVTGYVSINNSTETDYKTSDSFMMDMTGIVKSTSDYNEVINYDTNQKVSQDSVLNYLVKNNLLSSDLSLDYNGIRVTASVTDKFNFRNDSSVINKSDFLATLGKAVFGVKESRPIVFNTKAIRWMNGREQLLALSDYRPSDYDGNDTEFDYTKGDYSVFVSPNVYEVYYKELVSSGVVSLSEFSDSVFIETYNKFGTSSNGRKIVPLWSDSLGVYNPLSSEPNNFIIQEGSSVLGSGFNVSIDGFNVSITNKSNSWFFDEDLLTVDSLTYIERALRISEKEMTKTEADVINYKYGVEYLNKIPSENRDTVKFLVAKGVLNFENENEFKRLFKPLTADFFKTLIYRVHNKDARFNFSSIQLTDSDNYWLSKGFGETEIEFMSGNAPTFSTDVEEYDPNSEVSYEPSISNLFGLLKPREKVIADNNTLGNRFYQVTRLFNIKSNKFYYKGIELDAKTSNKNEDIIEVRQDQGSSLLKVKFKIKAASDIAAVAILDANITVKNSSGINVIGSVPAVSYTGVESSSKARTFVSQSALRGLPNFPILVVEDKYLINTQTDAKALILDDNKKALIGNHIINFRETSVYGLNGEVYYNLEIIKYLLTEGMLSSLDDNKVFYTTGFGANEKLTSVKNSSGAVIDNVYIRELYRRTVTSNVESNNSNTLDNFVNISQSNSTSNYLIYDISGDIGINHPVNMIVELKYVIPDSSSVGIDSEFLQKYKTDTLTLSTVYNSLYQRPSIDVLSSWWDSNINFNNSLLNYIMGTQDVTYVNSGYLMPSISVLGDPSEKCSDGNTISSKVDYMFSNGLNLSDAFKAKVFNNVRNKSVSFTNAYFTINGDNKNISSGNSALDGLLSERSLTYIVGDNGNYKNDSLGSYKESSYIIYGDYAQTTSNNNVYLLLSSCRFLTNYNKGSNTIDIKYNTPLKDEYQRLSPGELRQGYRVYMINSKGMATITSEKPTVFYCDGVELYPNSDHTGKFGDKIKEVAEPIFGTDWEMPDWQDVSLQPKTPLKKGFYWFDGKYYKVKKDEAKPEEIKAEKLKNKEVNVFLTFQIDTKIFRYDSKNDVIKKINSDPRLDMRNVTNSGIVSNIIESIVYHNSKYFTLAQVPNKSKIVIGTSIFEKNANYLESEVISDAEVATLSGIPIKNSEFPDAFKSLVGKSIGSISIRNRGFGSSNGVFTDYIKSYRFGKGQSDSKYDKTLKLNGKDQLIVTKGLLSDNYNQGDNFKSFCYAISLRDGLVFKQIGESGRYYLVPISTDRVDGFSNVPYFVESLSFKDSDSLISGLLPSDYSPAQGIDKLVNDILDSYNVQRIEDFKGLVSYLMRVVCTWTLATNLVLTLLRNDVIDSIVYDAKYGKEKAFGRGGVGVSTGNRFNVDIYSILTLGLQSVDAKPSIIKGVVVSGVLFIIDAFLFIGYFG